MLLVLSAGCAPAKSTTAVIDVDAATALADQPVRIKVTGLAPGDDVTVSSAATDSAGKQWHGQAVVRADGRGTVDLSTATPRSGSYQHQDGMGLFWSMNPSDGNGGQTLFLPFPPEERHSYQVRLAVTAHGRALAGRTLTREWLADGVTARELTVATDQVAGELFLPPADGQRHPAVILLGGSEGGNSPRYAAALLASHGYPTLSLGYFALPGLPSVLANIPLEYFVRAARLLAAQPGVDPGQVVALGASRGSEAALLLGEDYPDLFHAVVVYSPSAVANPGYPPGYIAWTKDGSPVPVGLIPLDRVSGPVLAVAGDADLIWNSAESAQRIDAALPGRHPHQALVYPDTGHLVDLGFPYLPDRTQAEGGGTRTGNEAARAASWPRLLAFLAALRS